LFHFSFESEKAPNSAPMNGGPPMEQFLGGQGHSTPIAVRANAKQIKREVERVAVKVAVALCRVEKVL
jgi:hypothetical protein